MVENCQRLGGLNTVLTGTWLKSIETILNLYSAK